MSQSKESEISNIIESLTSTGKKTLDDALTNKLKEICKSSTGFMDYAYHIIMTRLRKNHSEIRYSSLLIISELFSCSSLFRRLLENDFNEFLDLVVGTDLDKPLPLPLARSKDLKLKGIELVKLWAEKYGKDCKRIEIALIYLKNVKKIDFNDMEVRSAAQRRREQQESERLQRIINERVVKAKSEMFETSGELSNVLTQMENCFCLLVPPVSEDLFSPDDFKSSDSQKNPSDMLLDEQGSSNSNLRHHGIYDMKKSITINLTKSSNVNVIANEDNLPIIENLNDLYKQINTRYFPMVTKWLKVFTKGNNCTDSLKKAIDWKQQIEASFSKYKELKINPNISNKEDDEEDDDDFIEVKDKEGFEDEVRAEPVKCDISKPSTSKSRQEPNIHNSWKFKHSQDDVKDPTTAASTVSKFLEKHKAELPSTSRDTSTKQASSSTSSKSKLLAKAPVLPYDIDLYHWEEEKPILPERVKFDSLHNFWETKAEDEDNKVIEEAQMASLRTRKIDFSGKFEPVKWSCRAPLPNGKLCPRKDRIKCPFHGKIIKRDAMGNPADEKETAIAGPSKAGSSKAETPDWQDPSLLRDIEAATGVNLQIPKKGQRKKKDGLTDIKKIKLSAKERISKKIDKRYKHYAKKLDESDKKRFNDKFGDQWNYY